MLPNYQKSIVNVSNALLAHYGITPFHTPLEELKPSLEPRSTAFFVKPHNQKAFEACFYTEFGSKFTLMTKQALLESGRLGSSIKHPLLEDFIGDYIAISEGPYMFNIKENSPFKAHHAGGHPDELWVPLILLEK